MVVRRIAKLSILAALFSLALSARAGTPRRENPYAKLDVFSKVLSFVEREYVEPVDRKLLVQGAIEGLLAQLDPYSAYLSAEEVRRLKAEAAGEIGRTGLEDALSKPRPGEAPVIIAPVEGSAAWREGLLAGDLLLSVDGESTARLSLHRVAEKLAGKRGTTVRVEIDRPEWSGPQTRDLEREVLALPAVQAETLAPGYGYARLAYFRDRIDRELDRAITQLEESNSGALRGLVLDLRGNPGGLVTMAVAAADLFLDKGIIVSTEGRRRKLQKHYAQPANTRKAFPLVLLIDAGTASAAEILAGALQDHGRALILGRKSYGKGSVQELIELPDGSALKLTTRFYYTPDHRSIDGKGVVPDVELGTPDPAAAASEETLTVTRERDLEGHLVADSVSPAAGFTASEGAAELLKNNQVRAALDYLKSWEIFRGMEKAKR